MFSTAAGVESSGGGAGSGFSIDLTGVSSATSNLGGLVSSGSGVTNDLSSQVLDGSVFGEIGSGVAAANSSMQDGLSNGLSQTMELLGTTNDDIQQVQQNYAAADTAVASGFGGVGAAGTAGSLMTGGVLGNLPSEDTQGTLDPGGDLVPSSGYILGTLDPGSTATAGSGDILGTLDPGSTATAGSGDILGQLTPDNAGGSELATAATAPGVPGDPVATVTVTPASSSDQLPSAPDLPAAVAPANPADGSACPADPASSGTIVVGGRTLEIPDGSPAATLPGQYLDPAPPPAPPPVSQLPANEPAVVTTVNVATLDGTVGGSLAQGPQSTALTGTVAVGEATGWNASSGLGTVPPTGACVFVQGNVGAYRLLLQGCTTGTVSVTGSMPKVSPIAIPGASGVMNYTGSWNPLTGFGSSAVPSVSVGNLSQGLTAGVSGTIRVPNPTLGDIGRGLEAGANPSQGGMFP